MRLTDYHNVHDFQRLFSNKSDRALTFTCTAFERGMRRMSGASVRIAAV